MRVLFIKSSVWSTAECRNCTRTYYKALALILPKGMFFIKRRNVLISTRFLRLKICYGTWIFTPLDIFMFANSAAGPGFEPRYRAPEARVLPLDDPAALSTNSYYLISKFIVCTTYL